MAVHISGGMRTAAVAGKPEDHLPTV